MASSLSGKNVLESQFWNEDVETSRSVEAVVHTLPHEPPPVGLVRSNKLFRSQQLLLLQRLFSFPFTPCYSDGGFCLDRVIASAGGLNWWTTLTARAKTRELISFLRERGEGNGFSLDGANFWNKAQHLLCQSLCALGARARMAFGPNTSLSASYEVNNALGYLFSCNNLSACEKPWHARALLRHKLQQHDVVLEAAWNDECLDRRGQYWNVPEMVSLDLVSSGCTLGLRYRLGLHHSSGVIEAREGDTTQVPPNAFPGTHGQAAISLEKEMIMWRDMKHKMRKPYNLMASHPHATVTGVIGGLITANIFGEGWHSKGASLKDIKDRLSADAFASMGLSVQLGRFQRPLLDFSKLDARLDVRSASSPLRAADNDDAHRSKWCPPILEVTLQQQVAGPVRARVDSRFEAESFSSAQMQDLTYGLDCSLEASGAARLVIWYSPIRREGMVEIRVFER